MAYLTRTAACVCSSLLMLMITCGALAVTWTDQIPETPAIDLYYDFRPTIMSQPNWIAPWQADSAVSAFQTWSSAGGLNFIRNTWAPESQIINIGVSAIDGRWGILGQGGYNYTNDGGFWHIAGGIVYMDVNEHWDPIIRNGNPPGTFDFFTVTAHEIGHALGLDHSGNADDLMYPYYTGEKTWLSASDVANIQSLYGAGWTNSGTEEFGSLRVVPEPSTIVLLAMGLTLLPMMKRLVALARPSDSRITQRCSDPQE